MPRNYDEKRDYVRVDVDSELSYAQLDSPQHNTGMLKNLSGRGMMFIADHEIEKESLVDIKVVPSNNLTPPLHARVKIVRVMKQRHGEGFEIGAIIQSMLDE